MQSSGFFLRESLNQPLMVIFEDLHWIDEETQAFLNLLADSIGTGPCSRKSVVTRFSFGDFLPPFLAKPIVQSDHFAMN